MKSSFLVTREMTAGNGERGQTMTLVLLVLGLFLLGAVGLSVDVSNWWFHRQLAQGAADAACTAGVMDMLVNASGGSSTGLPAGSPPAAFSCSGAASTSSPCQYAAINGYNGSGRIAGPSNDVLVSFPSSVPGVPICGNPPVPPCIPGANSIIQVDVVDRVPTTFTGMLGGSRTKDIISSARCGVLQDTSPVPIIVLNPSCPHAFELSGNTTVQIVGGPPRSIQVNSNNQSCAAATSNAANQCNQNGPTIDLSKGGPNFTGSDFGVTGQPKSAPNGFTGATWSTAAPISDPFANVPAPAIPALSPTNNIANVSAKLQANVKYGVNGCPDPNTVTGSSGGYNCVEFQPGLYTNPIVIKGITAIFDPGIYYIQGVTNDNASSPGSGCVPPPTGRGRYGLDIGSNGVIRPSTATGDGSGGVMFYFSGAGGAGTYGSAIFGSDAGKAGGRPIPIDKYVTANAVCPGGPAPPSELNLPATVDGNVLVGPCTKGGTYIGAPNETTGTIRGLLFFQDRANADAKGQPSMQGGGGLVVSGNLYFHNCVSNGTSCTAPTDSYNAFFNLQGTPGGNAYVLGNITTDQLVLGGGGNISMALNPNAVYNILKASLLQ
jgi:hypothetical protein